VVVIDPAHGGSDSGARAAGATESEIVLDFARVLRVALEAQGLRVLLTREGNQDPSFDDRSTLINGLRDAVFISLHVSSTGPLGTVRAYSLLSPAAASQPATPASAPAHPGLLQWDRAQLPYLAASRQLAELLQIQLAQKFNGSPEVPSAAEVRQLRTIGAPAVAIEVSSVAAADAPHLAQMSQPLAEAVSRAIADYRPLTAAPAGASGGGR
jgi:N-acetylmuramoyl-L-alanine amidase